MADWASLMNAPPPSSSPVICESEGLLVTASDGRCQLKVAEVLAHLPKADPVVPDPGRATTQHAKATVDSSLLSAKQAFLPAKSSNMLPSEEGIFKMFEECLTRNEDSWWLKLIGSVAFNFKPRNKMSPEDMIAAYSSTRDWSNSAVRCLAWHPHVTKLAVAFKDDSVQVMASTSATNPVLKHKRQRHISCMAWRPFSSSELVVGCANGILIWTIDPASVVARPSAASVSLLPESPSPTTSLSWSPNGLLLMSASAADTTVYLWDTASENKTPLRRIGGGGVHLCSWSPTGNAILTATTSTVFRLWSTKTWLPERWNVLGGHINNACWSPCGTALLFTSSQESQIFCLRFALLDENQLESSGAAIPIMDLSKLAFTTDGGQEEFW